MALADARRPGARHPRHGRRVLVSGFEVTPATVIAFLTILGFSIYDGIVVFDKVDENTRLVSSTGRMTYSEMVNLSLNQVLMRSLNTSITALLPVALAAVRRVVHPRRHDARGVRARPAHRPVLPGAYSSIFIASPILALLKEREPRYRASSARIDARGGDADAVAADGGHGRTTPVGAGGGRRPTAPATAPVPPPGGAAARSSRPGPARSARAPAARSGRMDAGSGVADGAHPRHPRLPEAGRRVQGHHAAAADADAFRVAIDAIADHCDRRRASTSCVGHRGPRLHLRRRRSPTGSAPASCPCASRASCRGTSVSELRARVRHRRARDPRRRLDAGRAGAGRRRRARHRRHGRRHLPPRRAARGALVGLAFSSSWVPRWTGETGDHEVHSLITLDRPKEGSVPTVDRVLPWRRNHAAACG